MRSKIGDQLLKFFLEKRRKNQLLADSAASGVSPNHPAQGLSESELQPAAPSSVTNAQGAEASGVQARVHGVATGTDPSPVMDEPTHSAPLAFPLASPQPLVPAQAPTPETATSIADFSLATDAVAAPMGPGQPEQMPVTPNSRPTGLCDGEAVAELSMSAGPSPSASSFAASNLDGSEWYPDAGASSLPTALCTSPRATVTVPISAVPPQTPAGGAGALGQHAESSMPPCSATQPLSSSAPGTASRPASVVEPSTPMPSPAGVSQRREPTASSGESPSSPMRGPSPTSPGPDPSLTVPSSVPLLPAVPGPQLATPLSTEAVGLDFDHEGTSPSLPALGLPSHPVTSDPRSPTGIVAGGDPAGTEDQHMSSIGSPPSHSTPLDHYMAEAVEQYKKETGIDLNAMQLPLPLESEKALTLFLEECETKFTSSRERFPKQIRAPLRVLASLLQPFCNALGEGTALAFLAAKVVFAGLDVLLRAAKDVTGDFDATLDAVKKITDILPHIRIVAGAAQQPGSEMSQSAEATIPRLSEMERATNPELQKIDVVLRDCIIDVLVAILKVLGVLHSLKAERLKTWVKKLGQYKGPLADPVARLNEQVANYQRILQADIYRKTTNMQRDVSDMHLALESLRADTTGMRDLRENAALVQWLRHSDPSSRLNHLFDNRCSNTGTWFLDDKAFRDFKSGETMALWLRGQAGSGKSSILAAAIDELATQCAANSHQITLYHFFDATRQESCTLRALLGSLASQLLSKETTSRQPLMNLYLKCESGASEPSLRDLEETTLLLFHQRHTANELARTYVVIDALDEVDPSRRGPTVDPLPDFRSAYDAKQVVAFIRKLHGLGRNISLLVASRPAFSDVGALRRLFTVSVEMQDVGISHDVELVVARAFEAGGVLENVHADLQPVIRDRLLSNTGASFLWVTLQIQALSEHAEVPSELEQHLSEIPLDLVGTYKAALPSRPHIRRILVWMAEDAIGPVSPAMLTELLSGDHSDPMHPVFRGKLKPTPDGVISLIGTAFVTQTQPDSEDRTYIVFTHNTVKDFIIQFDLFEDERRFHSIHVSSMFAAYIHGLADDDICSVLTESYELLDDVTRSNAYLRLHGQTRLKDNLYTAAQDYWMPELGLAIRAASSPAGLVEHADTVATALAHYFSAISRVKTYNFSPFGIRNELLPLNDAFTALSVACSFADPALVEFLLDVECWTPGQVSHSLACVSLLLRGRDPAKIAKAKSARRESVPRDAVDRDAPDKEAAERDRLERWSAEERTVARVVELLVEHSNDHGYAGNITCTTAAIEHLCHLGYAGAVRHLCLAGLVDSNASIDLHAEGAAEPLLILTSVHYCSKEYRTLRRLAETLERSEADVDGQPPSSTRLTPATSRFAFLDNMFIDPSRFVGGSEGGMDLQTLYNQVRDLMKSMGVVGVPGYLGPLLTGTALCGSTDVVRVLVDNYPDLSTATEALASALNVAASTGHVDVVEVLAPLCSEQASVEAFICSWQQRPVCDPTAMFFLPTLCSLSTPIAVHAHMILYALLNGDTTMRSRLLEFADAKVKGLLTYYLRFEMRCEDVDRIFPFPSEDLEIMQVVTDIASAEGRVVLIPHPGPDGEDGFLILITEERPSEDRRSIGNVRVKVKVSPTEWLPSRA